MGRHEIIEQKRRLPIYQFKKQFLHAVKNNQVSILSTFCEQLLRR